MQPSLPAAVLGWMPEESDMADQHDTPKPGGKSETVSAIRDALGGGAAKALASITSGKQSSPPGCRWLIRRTGWSALAAGLW
jgi:hypothetical protein